RFDRQHRTGACLRRRRLLLLGDLLCDAHGGPFRLCRLHCLRGHGPASCGGHRAPRRRAAERTSTTSTGPPTIAVASPTGTDTGNTAAPTAHQVSRAAPPAAEAAGGGAGLPAATRTSCGATRATNPIGPTTATGTPTSPVAADRKSTRLNSSHVSISYAVFC